MLALLGCLADGPRFGLSRAGEDGRVLVFNNATEPEYLDPTQATGHPDGRIASELFDGLTEYDPVDLSPRPNHAVSWDTHPDGRGYTFHLRGDAMWSDGDPVTTADYLWSWEHVLNPVFLSRYAQQLYLVERGELYNGSRALVLQEQVGDLPAGTHVRAVSTNLANAAEDLEIQGVSVRSGATVLLTGRETGAALEVLVQPDCPDLSDLTALLDCGEGGVTDYVDRGLLEPAFPLVNARVMKTGGRIVDDAGEHVDRLDRGDEVVLLTLRDDRAKVYFPTRNTTGWVLGVTLTDPRAERVIYKVEELPEINWSGTEPAQDTGETEPVAWAPRTGEVAMGQVLVTPELLGLRAEDDHTLTVRLRAVAPYFLQLTSHTTLRVAPQQAWEAHGPRWTRVENIVTNGPFTLTEHTVRDKFVLDANPNWWGADDLAFDQVVAYSIDNLHTSANLYRAGYTDLVVANDIPVEFLPMLSSKEDFHSSPALSVYVYRINTDRPPLDDPRVRRALAMAIDKESVVHVRKGGEVAATHLVPPGLPGYPGAEGPGFDPEAARALLAEAGYPNGEGFPEISILYNTQESHKLVAAVIQANWKEHLGIEVELENREWKTYLKTVNGGDYDVARGGWIGDYLDPTTFLDLWITDGGNNNTNWSSPEYDQLLLDAGQEADPERRAAMLMQAEDILNDEMPFIPIYWYVWSELAQTDVQGTTPNLLDQHPIRYMSIDR